VLDITFHFLLTDECGRLSWYPGIALESTIISTVEFEFEFEYLKRR
jgi:hypothetical protein